MGKNKEVRTAFGNYIPTVLMLPDSATMLSARKSVEMSKVSMLEIWRAHTLYKQRVAWRFRKRNPKTRHKLIEKARRMSHGQN